MKKVMNFAVVIMTMILCSVFFGACSGSEIDGDGPKKPTNPVVESVERNSCTSNVVNTYTTDNAEIKTRAITVPQGNYEALISAKSTHQFIVDVLYKDNAKNPEKDSTAYTIINTVKGYGLKKTRYARSVKVFETWKEESKTLEDGRVVRAYTFNGEQGGEVFKASTIDEQTTSDESVTIQGVTFEDLCKNHWTGRKLVKVNPVYLNKDSLDFQWHRIDFVFNDALAYGFDSKGKDNRKVEFIMHGEKVWIPKSGTNPPIPDEPEEVITYTAKDKGFEFVKDSISTETKQKITVSKAWIQFEKLLSSGETKLSYRPEVFLYNRVDTPAIQTVNVSDFEIKDLDPENYTKLAFGDKVERGKNIFVQTYSQKFATKTNKAIFSFDGRSEEATVVDSLGVEHKFDFRTYEFTDFGTDKPLTDLEAKDGKERKLLVSNISATFNKRTDKYKGEAILVKLKDGQKKVGIDIINERPKVNGDKVVIEFDKETKYNDGSKDTIFNLVFDPGYKVTVEDIILVKNRNYARKSNEAIRKLAKKEATEVGTFAWQSCQYSNTFEYVGFNNALQAYVPESVMYTDEDGLSDEVKIPAWTLNWVKFAKSDKNEGDDKNQIYTDTIHYQFNLAETVTPIKPKQLLRATLNANDPTDPSAIRYEYGPKKYKSVDTQTIYVYREKYAIYDDGTRKLIGEIGHNSTFYMEVPETQEIVVDNLAIQKLNPSYGKIVKGKPNPDGSYTVTDCTQETVTKTQKSNQIYVAHSQDIFYTDEFGQEVDLTALSWEISEKSGEFSDLSDEGDYARKLFTSVIIGKYVNSLDYTSKVIFKKSKSGEGKKISYYIYSEKDMREVGDSTYVYMTQTPVYDDGSKGTSKEVGVNIGRKATVPAKQVKEVTDFSVTEGTPTTGTKTGNGNTRYNKGFRIKGFSNSYTTRSNKVSYVFGFESEEATFIDELGHEEPMKHSEWTFVNKNIKTEQISDLDGYTRYSSNSTIEATYNGVMKSLTGEAELKKKAAKKLVDVEYGAHDINYKSGNIWNAWQEYTEIYSDNSRVPVKKTVDLNYIVNAQGSKDVPADEAKAPFTGLTPGADGSTTRSGGENITVTIASKAYIEGYTIFDNTHTALSEKAKYVEVKDGVEIKFDFDAVEITNIAHATDNGDNIPKTSSTKVIDGITYDIYAHEGSLGYSVDGKNFTSTCFTSVLVKQYVAPNVPESFGRVKGLAGWTLVFDPNQGEYGKFRDCLVVDFENGKWIILDSAWNDFSSFHGWDVCYNDSRVRSAVKMDDGTYFPSTCTIDGTGWTYVGEKIGGATKTVDMSQQRALLAGIKNFTGDSTAKVTPERGGSSRLVGNTLYIYNKDGLLVRTIVSK